MLGINLKLSINFILYVIDLPLSSPFLIDTEKLIYFPPNIQIALQILLLAL